MKDQVEVTFISLAFSNQVNLASLQLGLLEQIQRGTCTCTLS